MARRRLDSWPTRQQESLLRAALLHGQPALEGWEEWRARTDIDHLDEGSRRLLPLLYRNLLRLGVREPILGVFRGVYRRAWYENQLLFHRVAELLRSLRDARIDAMVLKGAALAVQYYRDCGLRPMDDADLLVPEGALADAVRLLKAAGLDPAEGFPPSHVHAFHDAEGRRTIDLHWRVFPFSPHKVPEDQFWDGAVRIEIHGVSAYALNPSDQLLHVCVHGAEWNPMPTIRWVADAMTILSATESGLDWDRMCAQARVRRLTLPLQDMLGYLRDVFAAPIPESVVQGLRRERTSIGERIAYAASTRSTDLRGPWWSLYENYRHHCARLPEGTSVFRRLIEFPRYLQRVWRIEHLWLLPVGAGVKGLRWMARAVTRYGSRWTPPRA